jgi:hypothetical protein
LLAHLFCAPFKISRDISNASTFSSLRSSAHHIVAIEKGTEVDLGKAMVEHKERMDSEARKCCAGHPLEITLPTFRKPQFKSYTF